MPRLGGEGRDGAGDLVGGHELTQGLSGPEGRRGSGASGSCGEVVY
jgi:hypothetical protein